MVIVGSHKSVLEAERNVLLLSRPFCRVDSDGWQNGQGPVYVNLAVVSARHLFL